MFSLAFILVAISSTIVNANKYTMCDLDELTFYPSNMVCKGSYCNHSPHRIEAINIHCDHSTNYEPVWQYTTLFNEQGYDVVDPKISCATEGFYRTYLKTPITCQISYEIQPENTVWIKKLFDLVHELTNIFLGVIFISAVLIFLTIILIYGCFFQIIDLISPSFYNNRSRYSSYHPRRTSTITQVIDVPEVPKTKPKVVIKKGKMYENPIFDPKPTVKKVIEVPKEESKPHVILRQRKDTSPKVVKVIQAESDHSTKSKIVLKKKKTDLNIQDNEC